MVKARANQTLTLKVTAPRGIFYDRKNRIMVTTRISHNVSVAPEVKDKPEILANLGKILQIPEAQLREKIKSDPLSPRNQYIPIARDLDPEMVIKLLESKLDLPGVEVDEFALRYYPYGEMAAHLFGYIREINKQELERLRDKGYRLGDLTGKTGLEKVYEEILRGVEGGKIFEVDIHGRSTPLRQKESVPGNNLVLTIDLDLQQAAEKALEDQLLYLQRDTKWRNAKSGAVIALDPSNGNILTMVSKPGFDPNLFTGVITEKTAQMLYNNPLHPLTNRVLQNWCSPGSTFKPITVIASLMENEVKPEENFYCSGSIVVTKKPFRCWVANSKTAERPYHGNQTVIEGLQNSCNIVMAELSRRIGPDNLAKYARYFGLGKPTGINLPGENAGLVPDPDWKRNNTKEKVWFPLETIHFSIGQGYLTVTPIQLAQVYAAIANGGKVYRPQVVSRIITPEGEVIKDFKPQLAANLHIPSAAMDIVRRGLEKVVTEGTALWAFNGFPLDRFPVAGKTGTIQKPPEDDYGIFACYAPAHKPEIVVIVLVEQGGSGSGAGAPIARKVLETYFGLNPTPVSTSLPLASPRSSPVTTGSINRPAATPRPKPILNAVATPATVVEKSPVIGTEATAPAPIETAAREPVSEPVPELTQ